jgi:hypothetical protein
MADGHGWGGASRAGSNHPALAFPIESLTR